MEEMNPYAAPAESGLEIDPDNWLPPPPNPIASADERVTTLIVDGIVLGIVYVILVSSAPFGPTGFFMSCLTTVGIGFFYYFLCEWKYGKTLGKYFASTTVLTTRGEKPSGEQILKRTFARLIPVDAFFFLSEQGHPIGLHDSLSNTVVVGDKRWRGDCSWIHFDGNEGFSDTTNSSSEYMSEELRKRQDLS